MTNIEKNVMRRVRAIYYLRPIVSGGAFSLLVTVLALYGIGREVWVARVIENAPHGATDIPRFYLSAFLNTDTVVQVLSLLALVAVVYLARATAHSVAQLFLFARA